MVKSTARTSIRKPYLGKKGAIVLDSGCQTNESAFVIYAFEIFEEELNFKLQEENNLMDALKFKELLKKAEYIINRIKSKAATSYGLVGGSGHGVNSQFGPAVLTNKPNPFTLPTCVRKSWHFDVSSSQPPEEREKPESVFKIVDFSSPKNNKQV